MGASEYLVSVKEQIKLSILICLLKEARSGFKRVGLGFNAQNSFIKYFMFVL